MLIICVILIAVGVFMGIYGTTKSHPWDQWTSLIGIIMAVLAFLVLFYEVF